MGRSYFVEEAAEKYFAKLVLQQKAYVSGLIIGQCSAQRDYVLLTAQTPHKEEQDEGTKRKPALSKLDEIDDDWVSMHASQVCRMLPGGLLVLGVFLITSPDLTKDSQNALRKLIFAVEKSSMKNRLWSFDDDDVTDRVALHICSATKKVTCRTFDVKDPKSSAKPADWKYQSSALSWHTVQCNISVDVTVPLPSSSASYQERQKCTRTELAKWAKEIEEAAVLLNKRVRDIDGDLLDEQKKSSRSAAPSSSQIISANVLTPSSRNPEPRSTAQVQVCKSSLSLKGTVTCRGYIHTNKAKVRDAVQALKRDILNTVSDRCEILFEDLTLDGPQADSDKETCPLPQRVFVPVTGSTISLCDYIFGDEMTEDLHQRFLEMLDQDVQNEGYEYAEEKNIGTKNDLAEDISCLDNLTGDKPDTIKAKSSAPRIHHNIGLVLATGVALLAALLSCYYLLE
ncbi:protein odr-4 homolog [Discoglossus pictus]